MYIDGSNLFFTQRNQLGWNLDLRRFAYFIEHQFGQIVDATYYTGVNPNDEQQTRFIQMLPQLGYNAVTKPIKEINTVNGVIKKANLDIEIVLDMFNQIDNYDMAILFSGDSDFTRPLEQLRTRGKQFKVISTIGSISRELMAVAGRHFIDIREIEQYVRLPTPQNYSNNPSTPLRGQALERSR